MADIYFVGLGLSKRFLTNASLEVLKSSDVIYADIYTSISCDINEKTLREITDKEIIPATREVLETKEKEIYKLHDSGKNGAIAVVGDPMIATTHVSLATGARVRGHRVNVIPGVSVHCYMISRSMLSSYKFGKSVTVTFPVLDKLDYTPYRVIKANRELGLHTMVYLDLKETGIMTADLALNYLKKMESDIGDKVILDDDLVVIGERLGCPDERVRAMKVVDALNQKFGAPPHIIIVPSRNLYEMEVEGLKCLS